MSRCLRPVALALSVAALVAAGCRPSPPPAAAPAQRWPGDGEPPPPVNRPPDNPASDFFRTATRAIEKWRDDEEDRTNNALQKANAAMRAEAARLVPLLDAEIHLRNDGYAQALDALKERVQGLEKVLTPEDGAALMELGRLCGLAGRFEEARRHTLDGLAAYKRLTEGNRFRAAVLIPCELLAASVLARGDETEEEALDHANEAYRHLNSLSLSYPSDLRALLLTSCLLTRSELSQARGNDQAALDDAEEACRLLEVRYPEKPFPKGHFDLGVALARKAQALALRDRGAEARQLFTKALAMLGPPSPRGNPRRLAALTDRAALALQQGDEKAAADDAANAQDVLERAFPPETFPDGTPQWVRARNQLALVVFRANPAEAEAFQRTTWEKCRRLYPNAHVDKLATLLLLAEVAGGNDKRDLMGQAWRMAEELYPEGRHPRLAACRVQAAEGALRDGDLKAADTHLNRAADIYNQTLPKADQRPAALRRAQARLALRRNDPSARSQFQKLLAVHQEETRRLGQAVSAAEALAFARVRQESLDGLLSAWDGDPRNDDEDYAAVWASKGLLTRLLTARQRRLRAEGAPEGDGTPADLTAALRRHQGAVAVVDFPRTEQGLPMLRARLQQRSTAFVDFVRYQDFRSEKAEEYRYVAFVVTAAGRVRRVDLGAAGPIEAAIRAWRAAVESWTMGNREDAATVAERAAPFATQLTELVWRPLVQPLGDVATVYLATDGDLSRLPFAALPSPHDARHLLLDENPLIGYVPHGPHLLDQLRRPLPEGPGAVLLINGVATATGGRRIRRRSDDGPGLLSRIQALAAGRPTLLLEGAGATPRAVADGLATAGSAFVVAHGEFNERQWEADRRAWKESLTAPAANRRRAPIGAMPPLAYCSLAFPTAGDIARLSGEEIAGLALARLRLLVLCACETGLGKHTAGEGVQALLRAFHIAGCGNVVATLWKVPDAPTDDLMEEFYRQMADKGQPPLEALRVAQRIVCRRNERYHRGDDPPPPLAPVAAWGGVILSGAGL